MQCNSTVGSAKLSQQYKPQIRSHFVTTLPSRDLQVNRATPPLAQGRLNATPPSFVTQGRLFYPSPRSTLLVRGSEHFIRPWRISSVVYNGFHRPVCRFHPALAGRGRGARLGAARRGMTVCSTPLRGMNLWGFALCNICTKAAGKCWQK